MLQGELYAEPGSPIAVLPSSVPSQSPAAMIRNAAFTWEKDPASSGASTPGGASLSRRRNFRLQVDGKLIFKTGKLNIICGPTGSGKTSMLMALLGEMYYTPLSPDSEYNLPREGGVAYAAQESWVMNETIRVSVFSLVTILLNLMQHIVG